MKKVLLLNPPGTKKYFRDYYCSCVSKARYYYHPVDLVYLSGRLSVDYDVKVIDAIAENFSPEETTRKIKEINPQHIIFLLSSPSYDEDITFFSKLKKELPEANFIGTGDICREQKEAYFKLHSFLDAILLDFSTEDILVYLKKTTESQVINNMIYKEKGQIWSGPEKHGHGVFKMPVPKWELFPLEKYIFPFSRKRKYGTILTDFGCPFSCSFCPMSTLGFKLREIESVIEEIKTLKKLGVNEFLFRDQTFGVNKIRTYKLCERIIKEKLNISWTCFLRVDIINEEFLRRIKKAGCHTVMYGIETVNEDLLKKYTKGTKTKQIMNALKLSRKMELRTVGTFMIGLPGEDRNSIEKTIKFAASSPLDYASFNIAVPRFGTSLREDLLKKGLVSREVIKMDSAKSKPSWKGLELSNKEIFDLQKKAVRKFYLRPYYLFRRILKIKTFYELKEGLIEGAHLFFK